MNILRNVLPRRSQLVFSEDAEGECLELIRDSQCPTCLTVLKEHSHIPFGVDFVEPQAMSAPMVVMFKPSVSFVRIDLVETLRAWSSEMSFGVVKEGGKIRTEYMTMWFARSGWIDMYSDVKPVSSPCPRCGRPCGSGFDTFCYVSDLAGRDVVSSCGGFGLLISERVFTSIAPALRKELKFVEYQCRASKPKTE
jgi:hypothetical protein